MNDRRWVLLSYRQLWWSGEPLILQIESMSGTVVVPLRIEYPDEADGVAVIRFHGHGFIDVMDGWYPDTHYPTAEMLAALLNYIQQRFDSCIIDLAGLLPDSPLLAALLSLARQRAGLQLMHSPCANCLIADTSEGLGSWGQGFGQTLRKRLRRVERWGYRLELPQSQEARTKSGEALLKYHEKRWTNDSDLVLRATIQAIVTTAINAPEMEFPTLLTAQGHPVAVLLIFKDKEIDAFYAQGYDPEFKRISPSRCAIALYLRYLAECKHGGLDFLRGDEEYKLEFCNREYDLMRVTAAIGQVPLSTLEAVHSSFI
ncbi:MAG: GNAT family N-acetyltransferase [Oscillatoria sp. SIO1A7]|nr:GNAT family N-acetyltransferase [Oscillatoria sp. SIO1A7]